MKRFFDISSKAEFFSIVKYIRTHGERFVNETLSRVSGTERREYICGDMYLSIWYTDYSIPRLSLDIGDGKHYYYYPETGKVEVNNSNYEIIDIIVA